MESLIIVRCSIFDSVFNFFENRIKKFTEAFFCFFLFQRAGLQAEFEQDNITVFASSNSAWDSLPVGVLDYLQSDEVTAFFIPPSIFFLLTYSLHYVLNLLVN